MDTGLRKFEPIEQATAKAILDGQEKTGGAIPSVFKVGEILAIKGSVFRVLSIGRSKMKLKLLKK